MLRLQLLEQLATAIGQQRRTHPLRVGIDGIDAAGKTCLADELADVLRCQGREDLRASLDGFHNPRAVRYQRGALSPEGYYLDSFNYPLLRQVLLDPLCPGGSREIREAVFDVRADELCAAPLRQAAPETVLLLDGIFLFRPELADCWEVKVFLDIPFEESLRRALIRDLPVLGSPEVIEERYRLRYLPGQQMYLERCRPREKADFVVDHHDFQQPVLMKFPLLH